jgi:hypothetical protein
MDGTKTNWLIKHSNNMTTRAKNEYWYAKATGNSENATGPPRHEEGYDSCKGWCELSVNIDPSENQARTTAWTLIGAGAGDKARYRTGMSKGNQPRVGYDCTDMIGVPSVMQVALGVDGA